MEVIHKCMITIGLHYCSIWVLIILINDILTCLNVFTIQSLNLLRNDILFWFSFDYSLIERYSKS